MRNVETTIPVGHNGGQNGQQNYLIQFNFDYFKTQDGLLKIAQLFIAIICMSLASPAYKGSSHFFLFVVVLHFISTVLWSFVHFLGIKDAINLPINWILSEFVNCVIATLMYAAAFIIQEATWIGSNEWNAGANITAGVFGLLNTLAYATSSYYLYLQHKFNQSN